MCVCRVHVYVCTHTMMGVCWVYVGCMLGDQSETRKTGSLCSLSLCRGGVISSYVVCVWSVIGSIDDIHTGCL